MLFLLGSGGRLWLVIRCALEVKRKSFLESRINPLNLQGSLFKADGLPAITALREQIRGLRSHSLRFAPFGLVASSDRFVQHVCS